MDKNPFITNGWIIHLCLVNIAQVLYRQCRINQHTYTNEIYLKRKHHSTLAKALHDKWSMYEAYSFSKALPLTDNIIRCSRITLKKRTCNYSRVIDQFKSSESQGASAHRIFQQHCSDITKYYYMILIANLILIILQ